MTDRSQDITAIGGALDGLVPAVVRAGSLRVDPALVDQLLPDELAAVSRAVTARRSEFATGRSLLRRLTGTHGAIPVAPDRAPVLPPGWVASLAHAGPVVVALASDDPHIAALGVDLEPEGPMTDDELAVVRRDDDPPLEGRAVMVLKEAAYKAWSGLGGPLIDFHDVRLEVDADAFTAVAPGDTRLKGRWTVAAGHWLAAVSVTR